MHSDFQSTCDLFFESNCHKFTDDEENKLEYTQVHEAYIEILDKIIEGNILSKFSEDQVDNFYETFKDNIQTYNQESPRAVEILYSFIDFESFKKDILKFKADKIVLAKDQGEEQEDGQMQNQYTERGEDFFFEIYNEGITKEWSKRLDNPMKDGMSLTVHVKPQKDAPPLTRVETLYENMSLEAFHMFRDEAQSGKGE